MPSSQKTEILDGKAVANTVKDQLKADIDELIAQGLRAPGLAVVLVGDNPASHLYVKNKVEACKKVGIKSFLHQFKADVKTDDVLTCIASLNSDENVDGMIVQLPLPSHLPTDKILDAIAPHKDADGLHPHNLGLLASGKQGLRPCTPQGIMVLLENYKVSLEGKYAVVIGRSNLVGKPIALMLLEKHATVTMCHSRSQNLESIAQQADILVSAVGKECMVKGSWIKPGAIVVDVGIHKRVIKDGPNAGKSEIVGDVDFQEAQAVAGMITPVPGGIGPMTVAMLLANTLVAYKLQYNL